MTNLRLLFLPLQTLKCHRNLLLGTAPAVFHNFRYLVVSGSPIFPFGSGPEFVCSVGSTVHSIQGTFHLQKFNGGIVCDTHPLIHTHTHTEGNVMVVKCPRQLTLSLVSLRCQFHSTAFSPRHRSQLPASSHTWQFVLDASHCDSSLAECWLFLYFYKYYSILFWDTVRLAGNGSVLRRSAFEDWSCKTRAALSLDLGVILARSPLLNAPKPCKS